MRDAEADAQIARIQILRAKWHAALGLNPWRVTDEYERGCIEGHDNALAIASTQWEYRDAVIVWALPRVAQSDDEYLEWAFVHEQMHILLNEMQSPERDSAHQERVATDLASAFIATYNAGLQAPRRRARRAT